MIHQFYNAEVISRDQIRGLNCSQDDVLKLETEKVTRRHAIHHALKQSKGFFTKASITFETAQGLKQVDSVIWASTEKYIVLQGGITLPICCIRKVSVHSSE